MTQPSGSAAIASAFARTLGNAERRATPFRHWLLRDALPADTLTALAALPMTPPSSDTRGKRETHNAERSYCDAANRQRFAVCDSLAHAFQDPVTVGIIEKQCGVTLGGGFLRIEYCQDRDGFWLEPHTDIGAKLFTLLIYLSDDPHAGDWGTDLYDTNQRPAGRAPYAANGGLIFIPGHDTWHGFAPRPIIGTRRSLIVNYVKDEWRSRHELAFPDTPVRPS